jgi:replicative DNA helicase
MRAKHGSTSLTAGEAGDLLVRRIDGHDLPAPPITTGLADLDKIIGGLRRGDLAILAGRPGMMKTQLAAALALNVAGKGLAVLFHSLEMTTDAMGARMLGALAWEHGHYIAHKDILDQSVPAGEVDRVRAAADRLRRLPIMIDPRRGVGVAEICFRVRRWAAWHRRRGQAPGLVIIDHLGKIRPSGRNDNRSVELGDITTALADEAGESDVPILCLCQLNRAAESRDNKRPQLSDLRESGRIEEDARVVIGVYRESYYLSKLHEDDADREIKRLDRLAECEHDLEAIVLKNSHGPEGVAKLWVHLPSGAIRDREWR